MRVEFVIESGDLGGASYWLLTMIDSLIGTGFGSRAATSAVTFVDGPNSHEFERLSIPVDLRPTGGGPVEMAMTALALVRRWRSARIDVVVANGHKAAVVAAPAAALTSTPLVWIKHGYAWDESALGWVLARLVDVVVATSPQSLETIDSVASAVVTAPPAAERPLDEAAALQRWRNFGVEFDRPTLAVLGRVNADKGFDLAVRALAMPAGADWALVVIGADEPKLPGGVERLRRLSVELGVEDRVKFPGWVPDARTLLAPFDALAVLSRSNAGHWKGEGYSFAAVEAFRAGVPVIAAPMTPAIELAPEAAIRIADGDVAGVADALGRVAKLAPAAARVASEIDGRLPSASEAGEAFSAVIEGAARGRRPKIADVYADAVAAGRTNAGDRVDLLGAAIRVGGLVAAFWPGRRVRARRAVGAAIAVMAAARAAPEIAAVIAAESTIQASVHRLAETVAGDLGLVAGALAGAVRVDWRGGR